MRRGITWLWILLLWGWGSELRAVERFPDEPDSPPSGPTAPFKAAGSYEQALRIWKTPEDIHGWIAGNFSYDRARAARLSENRRRSADGISILTPSEFFERGSGVCVDLARFGVETLRRIDPGSDAKYLMIEFEPMEFEGNAFRLHWLVRFMRNGRLHFFADSKRPGHMAGPYDDVRTFLEEYEGYRRRKVVRFRELDTYQRRERSPRDMGS